MKFKVYKKKDDDLLTPMKLKLEPPKNAQYTVTKSNNDNTLPNKSAVFHGNRFEQVQFNTEYSMKELRYPWLTSNCYLYQKSLPNSKFEGKKLVILHLISLSKAKSPFTFLLSHGASATLGSLYPSIVDFVTQTRSDVIAYDYSGFGHSEGKAKEPQISSDVEEVGSFATKVLMIKPIHLIPFGISIGSMPSIDLGIHKDFNEFIPGMVLLSPYSLGFKQKTTKEGHIEYYNKVKAIKCPIFLIHGQKDTTISFEQSEGLAPKIQSLFKWFPSKGEHENIISNHRSKFYRKLKTFMLELLTQQSQLRVSFKIKIGSPSNRKKRVVINNNYAENPQAFDINLDVNQTSNNEVLFDLVSEECHYYSDEDFSNERHSRSIKKVGTFYFGQGMDDEVSLADSYNSDTELALDDIVIDKNSNVTTASPFKSPLKSSISFAMKTGSIKKKKSFAYGTVITSPLFTDSIKKMQFHNHKRNILSQKTFNYKKIKTIDELDLKPISDFPDLE